MKLEQSFEVSAPLERVWKALIDIERVAPCLPGAAVSARNDDGTYDGTFKVKIGPTSAAYSGKLEMRDVDEGAHSATMYASGTDRRGQGGAKATIVSKVEPAGDATRVEVVTDYQITGRLARFGRGGMIEDISNRLLREFAQCLQGSLGEGDGGAEADPEAGAEDSGGPGTATRAGTGTASSPEEAVREGAEAQTAATPDSVADIAPARAESSEAVEGLSLLGSVLWGRVKRSPAAVAAVVGFLLAMVVFRRRK